LGMAADFNGNTEKRVERSDSVLLFVREIQTQSILMKLDEGISMPFANEAPLEDVLKYIRSPPRGSTTTESRSTSTGGLQEAEKTETSPVRIDLEGVPLRMTLRLLLRQIGLAYQIRDGLLVITSEKSEGATAPERKPGSVTPGPRRS